MQEVITIISKWYGSRNKQDNKNITRAISEGERSNKRTMRKPGIPQPGSPRSHGASRKGITNHLRSLRSKQRERRVATRVVKRKVKWKVKRELMWERAKVKLKQPSGCAQSPLSSAFRSSCSWVVLCTDYGACLMGIVPKPAHLESCQVWGVLWDLSALANNLHELEDCVHHLCEVISVHLALPMTCLHLWLYVAEAVWLFAPG